MRVFAIEVKTQSHDSEKEKKNTLLGTGLVKKGYLTLPLRKVKNKTYMDYNSYYNP